MKSINLLFRIALLLLTVTLYSCGGDSDSNNEISNGYTPQQIVGKTLVLKNKDGSIKLSAKHLSESGVTIDNVTIDYAKYPPSYSYSIASTNKANYYLKATKKTYIPYYGTYSYATFVFDVNLSFTSAVAGTYTGIQTNGNGTDTTIKGTFTLN